ncbi:hypothetical protein TYRP_023231 [Tyrophagus putrescentiae]|nr:hypothetical protein TYRP_023231 [Tyrophagus putrescentiae]
MLHHRQSISNQPMPPKLPMPHTTHQRKSPLQMTCLKKTVFGFQTMMESSTFAGEGLRDTRSAASMLYDSNGAGFASIHRRDSATSQSLHASSASQHLALPSSPDVRRMDPAGFPLGEHTGSDFTL